MTRRGSAREAFAQQVGQQVATMQERSIARKVGALVDAGVDVEIRKPRWMPTWAYRRLLRTIVVTRRA